MGKMKSRRKLHHAARIRLAFTHLSSPYGTDWIVRDRS